ncbi:ArsR/SmtB family transcription factor [Rhodococcus opacus]|uniref:ArsR/SmtB family transcription factor n=1 Tax=Rhodococcus opacus TaxID=37919 RepID=UPI001C490F4E|nr:metalloregulator ArsR/SmtB family transcription factor [Rhodococcus opacus]MBV6760304.1 metalloregulator ArsR/SmtB family transcription factor [Rhodococcus opacus]
MPRDAPVSLDAQVELFKAMADPVRLDLLKRIASVPEMACTDLVEESHVAKSTVSYHMKALRTAGLIEVRKEGRNFHYAYRPDALEMLTSILGEIGR